jgi:drug/metabolite transporter (DMT)-like permease
LEKWMKTKNKATSGWRLQATTFGLLAAFLFGLATPASKVLLNGLNPFLLAGLLYLGAAVGVTPLILREQNVHHLRHKVSGNQYLYIIGAVACGGFLGPTLLLFGLKASPASSVAIWLNMELVATAILGVLFFHDHLGRSGWLAVLLALGAGIIMTIPEGQNSWLAAALVTAACFCWGFDNHFTALVDCLTPARITLFKGIFAGSVNVAIGLSISEHLPTITLVLMTLTLGTFAYGASIVLYVMSAQHLGATRSQILFSSSPFFGVALAALLLHEPLLTYHFIAIACIAAAIYFSSRIEHAHDHSHSDITHTHLHHHKDEHHDHTHQGITTADSHSHTHSHTEIAHSHPHYPDLHHRHEHADEQ